MSNKGNHFDDVANPDVKPKAYLSRDWPVGLPNEKQILHTIAKMSAPITSKDIAKAFNLKGEQRRLLRQILRDLQAQGKLDRGDKRRVSLPGRLPEVTLLDITHSDDQGNLYAIPVTQHVTTATSETAKTQKNSKTGAQTEHPVILLSPIKGQASQAKIGDRILARLRRNGKNTYAALPIRILNKSPQQILGVIETTPDGYILKPVDKKNSRPYLVNQKAGLQPETGQLVLATTAMDRAQWKFGPSRTVQILKILGLANAPLHYSLIALHRHGIPMEFSDDAIRQAQNATVPPLGKRRDMRNLPLVTIDGADARDFDDAVFATKDTNPDNIGGWKVIVAIADVAHYVTPHSALDTAAAQRGNSVYFPDRVVPMLPEALSNDICSLKPNTDRACLAVELIIDKAGIMIGYDFFRGLMRSHARLTYEKVHALIADETGNTADATLRADVIKPLYDAYNTIKTAWQKRQPLDLDIKEHQVECDKDGTIKAIRPRMRLESHRLIEVFMVTANVAAARALEERKQPVIYRVHEPPPLDKQEALRQSLEGLGLTLPRGIRLQPHHLARIIQKTAHSEKAHIVAEIILRAQAQAIYSPENLGHFGLSLGRYAHFTSPIRRYADILVHRALITGYGLGDGGLAPQDIGGLSEISAHISTTERRAIAAERETLERYVSAFLAEKISAEFDAKISGIARFGLFVTLNETGANGLVPMRSLPDDYYFHDETAHQLVGEKRGWVFALGDPVLVVLQEANPITGGLIFSCQTGGKQDAKTARKTIRNIKGRKGRTKYRRKGQKG